MALTVAGWDCGSQIDSSHDRRFVWSGVDDADHLTSDAWGRGACKGLPEMPSVSCDAVAKPTLPACDDCGIETISACNDTCAAARCGSHGTCTARFMGSDVPVSIGACICEPPYTGPTCERDPCQQSGENCNGRGTCIGVGDVSTRCECNFGYSGSSCELDCSTSCTGNGGVYPYGCAAANANPVHLCQVGGEGCQYTTSYSPSSGWCAYKVADACGSVTCAAPNDCHLAGACVSGTCSAATPLPDGTPCSRAPWGRCSSGVCIAEQSGCIQPPPPPLYPPPILPSPDSSASTDAAWLTPVFASVVTILVLGSLAVVRHLHKMRHVRVDDSHGKVAPDGEGVASVRSSQSTRVLRVSAAFFLPEVFRFGQRRSSAGEPPRGMSQVEQRSSAGEGWRWPWSTALNPRPKIAERASERPRIGSTRSAGSPPCSVSQIEERTSAGEGWRWPWSTFASPGGMANRASQRVSQRASQRKAQHGSARRTNGQHRTSDGSDASSSAAGGVENGWRWPWSDTSTTEASVGASAWRWPWQQHEPAPAGTTTYPRPRGV